MIPIPINLSQEIFSMYEPSLCLCVIVVCLLWNFFKTFHWYPMTCMTNPSSLAPTCLPTIITCLPPALWSEGTTQRSLKSPAWWIPSWFFLCVLLCLPPFPDQHLSSPVFKNQFKTHLLYEDFHGFPDTSVHLSIPQSIHAIWQGNVLSLFPNVGAGVLSVFCIAGSPVPRALTWHTVVAQ